MALTDFLHRASQRGARSQDVFITVMQALRWTGLAFRLASTDRHRLTGQTGGLPCHVRSAGWFLQQESHGRAKSVSSALQMLHHAAVCQRAYGLHRLLRQLPLLVLIWLLLPHTSASPNRSAPGGCSCATAAVAAAAAVATSAVGVHAYCRLQQVRDM